MEMTSLLVTAIALLAGLLMTRVFKLLRLNFPDVTAFLIAGLLVGPYCLGKIGVPGLGFMSMDEVDGMSVITNAALGFIAFAIGNEFRMSQLRQTGKQATIVGIVQGIVAMAFVDIALIGLHYIIPDKLSLPAAITLGSIATATAPAATLMVVRQFKAKGKLTYKLAGVSDKKYRKYFKVSSKTGKITVKKGIKRGKYKLRIKVRDAGDFSYKAKTRTANVIVRIR